MLWRLLIAWALLGLAGLVPEWFAFVHQVREIIHANGGYSDCPHCNRRRRWWRMKAWAWSIAFGMALSALGGPLTWLAMAVKVAD